MDKKFLIGVCTGMAILSIVTYLPTIAEALYSVPPTNAWNTITVNNSATFPNSSEPSVSAISYRDTLYLVSDGSILLNITTYSP